jgi:glutathione S-transferase
MAPVITAFRDSPDRGRGVARDMRVRWALEEAGVAYDVRLVTFEEMKQPAHKAIHPFGQIPTFEDGDVAIFESGAITFHIAQSYPGLLPDAPGPRASAVAWMFAALNTIEPPILDREVAHFTERDKPWHAERQPGLEQRIRARLDDLAAYLGDSDWLVGDFTAADIVMVTVLRRLGSSAILDACPTLTAYIARAEARPAYQRAYADQYAVFEKSRL